MYRHSFYQVPVQETGCVGLYHLTPNNIGKPPVVITHGTISNGESVLDLAQHLQQLNIDCWILEWGGHGQSKVVHTKQNFEYPALNDVPAAIDFILSKNQHDQVHWVSHSGGGHLAFMCLARYPEYREKVASIISLGAQATDGALGLKFKARAIALYCVTRLYGFTPEKIAAAGTEGEPSLLLAQWAKWNLTRRWLGVDGFDYLKAMSEITHPTLIVSGTVDDIAPVSGCLKFYNALGSDKKYWIECGKHTGFSKDFNHGHLVRGTAARVELFPKLSDWLNDQL